MVRAVVLGAALVALTGAGQARDERASARAFVDAFGRYFAAAETLPQTEPTEMRACVERVHRRIAEHRWDELLSFPSLEDDDRPFARQVHPILMRLSTDLHAVPTADPALLGGRTAIRRVRRAFAAIEALPRIDVCAEVRRWVRGGFEPTPVLRRIEAATAERHRVTEGDDVDRRVAAMTARMRELGVPDAEVDAIEGGD
jgi:hypothetical protein